SGVLQLAEKLGPILWQLPPSLPYDASRLESFLSLLPRDTTAAAKLARQHDARVRQPSLRAGPRQPLQHALEVRHASFQHPAFIAQLRRHHVALVVADTAGKWPFMEDITAGLIYVRLHGDEKLYVSGYTPAALDEWARKIRRWHAGGNPPGTRLVAPAAKAQPSGRDVFVYFDNDVKTRAPYDAMNLAHRLKLGPKPPEAPPIESIAEEPRTVWAAFPTTKSRALKKARSRKLVRPAQAPTPPARRPKKSPAGRRTNGRSTSP
ncbi:MAG: DUF72 domain-containing protein, partial [Opitutaceae bacterium]